jgi:DNA polymerase III alpha subunit
MKNHDKSSAGPGFVHLHVHSSYSLLEGALTIPKLADLAKADHQPAIALTDTDNMFGALEFSEKMAGAGIQPIVGCALSVDFGDQEQTGRNGHAAAPQRIVLLAARESGYRSLMRLNSRAFLETPPNEAPHVKLDWLDGETGGLIALSGGPNGPLDTALAAGQSALAGMRAEALQRLFGDRLYIELQRHGVPSEKQVEPGLLDIAYSRDIPLVATNEPFFAKREDYEAHDALICIAEGRLLVETDRRQLTPEYRFKTRAEMASLFADLPEALASTVEIAQRCSFRPRTRAPVLPRFSVGSNGAEVDEAAQLRQRAEEGLDARLAAYGVAEGRTPEQYRERLDFELRVIEGMKYPGYFLIVSDFIQWAKDQGIPVGPGRGSGAGSLVAYALKITDLDPLRFDLLFERFLNPERVSMPDFDIDFCQDRRDEVIRYVQSRYGRDQVAQIITFGTLQARGVLRDVGRVLQMPYGQVDKLCKLVPQNPANPVTLARAIDDEPKLQAAADAEPVVRRAFDIAKKLEGLTRHASTHAAGIVIGDRPLAELVPLYRDPKSNMPVTQFNMKWVEPAGLVKFDFLGLKTLTVLKTAVDFVEQARGVKIDLSHIPLDDEKTYGLLARAEAVGVFQLESAGMRRALLDMRPDTFTDIIALVAYQTAYMKANYPVEFMAASMTLDMGNTDKLAEFREEAKRLGIEIVPPSINRSGLAFEVEGNKIHYALGALKGVGAQAVRSIVATRGNGPFTDLTDFASRIDPRAVNKRVLESLVAAGAFDALERDRARAFAGVDAMMAAAQRAHESAVQGQSELFGGKLVRETLAIPAVEPWLPAERLQREYDAIGFFLSGHPLDDYAATLKRMRVQSWAEFSRAVKAGASAGRLAATVVSRTERRIRSGSKMGIVGLSDPSGHYEAVLFAEGLAQYRELLEPGKAVLLFLSAEVQGDEVRARIQSVEPLEQAAAKLQKGLRVFLREGAPLENVAKRLEAKGDGEVSMVLVLADDTEVEVKLPGRFNVSPQIAGAIKAVPGVERVEAL